MIRQLTQKRKKILVIFVVGLVIALAFCIKMAPASGVLLTDVLFIISALYFLCGLFELVSNIGFFNGIIYGTKTLYRIAVTKIGSSTEVKEEYIDYVRSRIKHDDVNLLLLLGVGFFLLSVLSSLL